MAGPFLLQQAFQTVPDFRADLGQPHIFFHHQLAGKRGAARGALAPIKRDAAILAVLIPAEAAIGNSFGREILKTAQHWIVFWNFKVAVQYGDFHQPRKRPEQSGRRGHAVKILRSLSARDENEGNEHGLAMHEARPRPGRCLSLRVAPCDGDPSDGPRGARQGAPCAYRLRGQYGGRRDGHDGDRQGAHDAAAPAFWQAFLLKSQSAPAPRTGNRATK